MGPLGVVEADPPPMTRSAWKPSVSSCILLESQLSRMNCHMFSTGFSSGALGGKNINVMLDGISSLPVVCHPARSMMSTA